MEKNNCIDDVWERLKEKARIAGATIVEKDEYGIIMSKDKRLFYTKTTVRELRSRNDT